MSDITGAGTAVSGVAQGAGAVAAAQASADATKYAAEQARNLGREGLAEQAKEFDVTSKANAEQFGKTFGLASETQKARESAYNAAKSTGASQMASGEAGFMDEANKTPEELEQMKADIVSGTDRTMQRTANQMNADLSRQGVRGGQAATQLARGVGEVGIQGIKDVNTMTGNDAMQRAAERRAYLANKASKGQGATLVGSAI